MIHTGDEGRRLPRWRALAGGILVVGGPLAVVVGAESSERPVYAALLGLLAIGGAATIGGAWFGLATAACSLIAFLAYLLPSRGEWEISGGEAFLAAGLFTLTALAITALITGERQARLTAVAASRDLEAADERSRRLALLAAALAEAVTPQQVLDATLAEGVAAADARAALLASLSEDGQQLEVVAQRGYADELVGEDGTWRTFPVDAELPLSVAVRTREPVYIETQAERDGRFPLLVGSPPMDRPVVCLPLMLEGEVIGGLVFSFAADAHFDEERRGLKVAIANQVAQALGRARLYEVARAAQSRADFLAEASAVLSSSLDYEETLGRLAQLAVPRLADWCVIDMATPDGHLERLAVAHQDPAKVAWARELQERHPPNPDEQTGVANVIRTGEPELLSPIPQELLDAASADDPELTQVIRELGLRSWLCVPLRTRGRTLGALSLVTAESGRLFGDADFELARELGDRAAVAVDNARLFEESVQRGNAALALAYTGDAVVLLDEERVVRHWNPAAARVTGVDATAALGRPIEAVLPAWPTIAHHVQPAHAGELARPATVPIPTSDGERWVSVTAVEFSEGAVYALRDVTAEQELERARSDFVATASHELRTPIAAVYGAVRTLLRPDLELSADDTDTFLKIIETESDRLAHLVQQILLAGQIDAGGLRITEEPCDVGAIVESVLASARLRAPENVRLELQANGASPTVAADEDKLTQVIANLVENAVKYSPDGGTIVVQVSAENGRGLVAVTDQGLGIPPGERERIFEKFYRLDPSLTRGIGGSGLGLYITRELVERMHGRLTVESTEGEGSTFVVELPTTHPDDR